jgi:hypothetical protein
MSLLSIAGFAADNAVGFRRPAPARQWHQVVHGQVLFFEPLTAVVAEPLPEPLTPPLRLAKSFGLLSLSLEGLL